MVLRLAAALGLLVCGSGEPTVIFRSNFTEPPWVAIYHVRLNLPILSIGREIWLPSTVDQRCTAMPAFVWAGAQLTHLPAARRFLS